MKDQPACPDLDELRRYNREARKRACQHRRLIKHGRSIYYCLACEKDVDEFEYARLCGRKLAEELKPALDAAKKEDAPA